MDTGIGVDGYSIIGQGKIADIVSTKPEARREIFEEAAGIVMYKSKRNEAERKLESTNANLERVRDIIAEIENTLGATVTIERDISLIAVVGRNMVGHYGICAAIFKILCENQINVKMITQSPDELNIIVGIAEEDFEKALLAIHDAFTS